MDSEKDNSSANEKKQSVAIWALTPDALKLAIRLKAQIDGARLFVGKSMEDAPPDATRFGSLSSKVGKEFDKFSDHIFIMAVGIVVRVIAPHVKNKRIDPAVVALDDGGNFAISLLSGHLGGANRLAAQVAEMVCATPVVTTATDVHNVPAIDVLAAEKGLTIENPSAIKNVGMAFLRGEKIDLVDPYAILRKDLDGWFVREGEEAEEEGKKLVRVSVDHGGKAVSGGTLMLRPKTLSVGVGCNRDTPAEEIRELIKQVFEECGLSLHSIENIATIEAKADEQGIVEVARQLDASLVLFDRDKLSSVESVPTPSKVVEKHMGVTSVCEAAAILASGSGKLLAKKHKTKNATVAVAARPCT